MCKYFEKEIDFTEARNDQGWEEKDIPVCALKKEKCKNSGNCSDLNCQFAAKENYTECSMYSA